MSVADSVIHTRAPSVTTVNIVIDTERGRIWVEDKAHDTFPHIAKDPFLDRVGRFIDRDHVHLFASMRDFTFWSHAEDVAVDKCWLLGETLSDEEREA